MEIVPSCSIQNIHILSIFNTQNISVASSCDMKNIKIHPFVVPKILI